MCTRIRLFVFSGAYNGTNKRLRRLVEKEIVCILRCAIAKHTIRVNEFNFGWCCRCWLAVLLLASCLLALVIRLLARSSPRPTMNSMQLKSAEQRTFHVRLFSPLMFDEDDDRRQDDGNACDTQTHRHTKRRLSFCRLTFQCWIRHNVALVLSQESHTQARARSEKEDV